MHICIAYMCKHLISGTKNTEAGLFIRAASAPNTFACPVLWKSLLVSGGAVLLSPVFKLGLNYSKRLEKMAAQRPITLEGNTQQGNVLL